MKTDTAIQNDVREELSWEPSIQAQNIGVTVKDGVVTLTGNVPTYGEKSAAECATKRVSGVRAIAEELVVELFGGHTRDDADIAKAAKNAIDWNSSVPHDQVKVIVEKGWVKLSGEVDWYYQSEAAHDAVRFLLGVKGVSNQINLKAPSVSAIEVRGKIETALKRNMMNDSNNIKIVANEGKITLSGKVKTWEEHDEAGRAAWSTLGVSSVENDLVISY
jgi:osmotically-inducible protein OsmY